MVPLREAKGAEQSALMLHTPSAQSQPAAKPAGLILGAGNIFVGWNPADYVLARKTAVSSYTPEPAAPLAPAGPAALPQLAAQAPEQFDAPAVPATTAPAQEKVWLRHACVCAAAK